MAYEKELAVAAMVLRGVGSRFFYRQFLPRLATSMALFGVIGVMSGLLLIIIFTAAYFAALHFGMGTTGAEYVLAAVMTFIAAFCVGTIAYSFRRLAGSRLSTNKSGGLLESFLEGFNDS